MHNNEKQNRSGSANASRATSFCGTYTAIITPFTAAGYLDKVNLQRQITRQIEGGVNGIVPVGTTGESSGRGWENAGPRRHGGKLHK